MKLLSFPRISFPLILASLSVGEESVFDRNLLSVSSPKIKDILENCDEYDVKSANSRANFLKGDVLGYVTPWNSRGYDVAKIFKGKINLISPVWLQISPNLEILGLHDLDKGWVRDLSPSKVLPRVIFDNWRGKDFVELFENSRKVRKIGEILLELCLAHNFNGIVLEVWNQLGGQARDQLAAVVKGISKAFRYDGKLLVLVIPPAIYRSDEEKGFFEKPDFDALVKYVDYFSLMTYDYSQLQRPGPNAPIKWVRKCVEYIDPDKNQRSKILLGLNFYGLTYTANGGRHIVNHEYKDLLKKVKNTNTTLKYSTEFEEHSLEIKIDNKKNRLYYPTLKSIYARVELAKELGTGLSIWEIGQGLDYFYDLI